MARHVVPLQLQSFFYGRDTIYRVPTNIIFLRGKNILQKTLDMGKKMNYICIEL